MKTVSPDNPNFKVKQRVIVFNNCIRVGDRFVFCAFNQIQTWRLYHFQAFVTDVTREGAKVAMLGRKK